MSTSSRTYYNRTIWNNWRIPEKLWKLIQANFPILTRCRLGLFIEFGNVWIHNSHVWKSIFHRENIYIQVIYQIKDWNLCYKTVCEYLWNMLIRSRDQRSKVMPKLRKIRQKLRKIVVSVQFWRQICGFFNFYINSEHFFTNWYLLYCDWSTWHFLCEVKGHMNSQKKLLEVICTEIYIFYFKASVYFQFILMFIALYDGNIMKLCF